MSSTTALAPADGLQLAIDGILIEAQRTLEQRPADPHQLERVIELAELAQSIVVRKRRFKLEDEGTLSVEDAFDEENFDVCGPGLGYVTTNPAGIRAGRPRKRARQRGVRNANVTYAGGAVGYAHQNAPFNLGAGVQAGGGGGLIGEAMAPVMELIERQNADRARERAAEAEERAKEQRRDERRDLVSEITSLARTAGGSSGAPESLRQWAAERIERLQRQVDALDAEPESEPDAEPEPEPRVDPSLPVQAVCTSDQCDQVQGPSWRLPGGEAAPCDICGSPMRWSGNPHYNPQHSVAACGQ